MTTKSGENSPSGIVLISELHEEMFFQVEEGTVLKFLHKYPGLSHRFYSLCYWNNICNGDLESYGKLLSSLSI